MASLLCYKTFTDMTRIILDAATRRFQAHKIYMRTAAAMRWVHMRSQVLQGQKPNGRHVQQLRRIDQHLREVSQDVMSILVTDLGFFHPRGAHTS